MKRVFMVIAVLSALMLTIVGGCSSCPSSRNGCELTSTCNDYDYAVDEHPALWIP